MRCSCDSRLSTKKLAGECYCECCGRDFCGLSVPSLRVLPILFICELNVR